MRIDWVGKLENLLQVLAFCMAIAALQVAFLPEKPYGPPMVYSLYIGTITWAGIDLGRHLVASARETGWPQGMQGLALVLGSIVAGYFAGNFLGDLTCRTFGLYGDLPPPDRSTELRHSILVTALAGIAGSYYFYAKNRSAYLERKMGEAKKHASEARLKLLEAQLEPHMLFNTLANLRALISVDPTRAQQMLDHMIAYLRATLGASRAATHPLEAEFERLGDYLALMAIRMGPRLAYALDLPKELEGQPVPTLVLQPLVENSIRHGLEPKVGGGRIDVKARREGDRLLLEVADTGVGTDADLGGAKGFGLAQIRERLATLYGSGASLSFDSRPGGGLRASVSMPIAA